MDAQIKSSEILSNVKQMLRLQNSDNDIFLNSLIETGARDLNTNETLIIKNCIVTVGDNKFYLPKDCKTVLAFRSLNSCIPGVFVDIPFFKHCGCNQQFMNSLVNVLDINGRWGNLINTVPDGTEIELAYKAVNVDEDGQVIINEEAYTALTMYACFWFANSYPELYTPEQRRNWQSKYETQANRVRGAAARRRFEQDKMQIRQAMTQIVNASAPITALIGTYNSFYYPTITST